MSEKNRNKSAAIYITHPTRQVCDSNEFLELLREEQQQQELSSIEDQDVDNFDIVYSGELQNLQNELQELTAAGKTDSLYYRNLKQMVEECEDLKITLENEGWDFNY